MWCLVFKKYEMLLKQINQLPTLVGWNKGVVCIFKYVFQTM